ncbi:hypothetical protein [Hymenobacter cellulosilyticus]|uniref:STAS/SEC14 domain-containing protein n=1 Tax=Hymenobacter cellulosilyticus TaxID=2932248 RepID=A0A8T9Q6Y2_9BACT|nr:hypothetical protein [Hymenobacter cellulosilyticus]UOQ73356.1 hypothetical protein MUN79_05190 [Hymenobacter cellulosilyticus]
MPTPAAEFDFLRLTYRPDLRILFLRWLRLVSSQEHRAGYEAALDFARQHQAAHWLIDLRIRGLAEAQDFSWVMTEFRSAMQQALPDAVFRVAYLVTPYHRDLIDSRLPAHETVFRTFIEEQAAYQWLGVPVQEAR